MDIMTIKSKKVQRKKQGKLIVYLRKKYRKEILINGNKQITKKMKITNFKTAALIAFIGCLLKAIVAIICLLINISPTISMITDIVSMCLIGFFFISLYTKINWKIKEK